MNVCLKSLWAMENTPDNPFPTMARTLNNYIIKARVGNTMEAINHQTEGFKRNQMLEESEYGITSVAGMYNAYGVKNVLEVLDPNFVPSLLRNVSSFCHDTAESYGDIKFEITHAIGGGYLFKSRFF